MREIKFDAWLKQHDIMLTVDSIDFAEEEIMIIDDTGIDRYFPFEEIELLQYTGLKDKFGKEEIRRGDALSSVSAMQKETGYVDFDDGAFIFVIISSNTARPGDKYFLSTCKELEVIGNIYQHPHLLEGATNGSS